MSVEIDIITCPQWGATAPKEDIVIVNKALRFIEHHTAGHHAEIENPRDESEEESKRYARAIQIFHKKPGSLGSPTGGIDSGHNFLICRNGLILQGRWITVSAIQHGKMVQSAHCPTQNGQIGVEFEHLGDEPMTAAQRNSGGRLMAWVAWKYKRKTIMPMDPHRKYINTTCPANLVPEIPKMRAIAADILRGAV